MKPLVSFLPLLVVAAASAAVPSVGPDYHRPEIDAPIAWKQAAPAGSLPVGVWWSLYHDSTLAALIERALAANQDLVAAAARVEQARAAAGIARSAYFPSVNAVVGIDRGRPSADTANRLPVATSTLHRSTLPASWELDLFGRIRRLHESARADAVASLADFAQVRLALTADVAAGYFTLRSLERELTLVADGVALRRQALDLVNARRTYGAATDFDVARAETELATTEAEWVALASRRSAAQNALAVLLGENAPTFTFSTPETSLPAPPIVPAGLPSELLERRPDIAAAEAALAAANARIGVAKAAFFPAISLTGTAGSASGEVDRLFQSDTRLWSIGPSLYLPIFQGGRNRANLDRSRAAWNENVAHFRQRILVAFQEVQDALTAAQLLNDQAAAQSRAVEAARRAGALAQTRYEAGIVAFFEVIDAQRTTLATERAATQLEAQRLLISVGLIKALGGGWNPAQIAPAENGE